jgi:hypothetical protein
VVGDILPIQVIERNKLRDEQNLWIKNLAGGLKRESLKKVLEAGTKLGRDAPKDAYLYWLSISNKSTMGAVMTFEQKEKEFWEMMEKFDYIAKAQEKNSIEIAKRFIADKTPLAKVARCTGLSLAKVKALRKQIDNVKV